MAYVTSKRPKTEILSDCFLEDWERIGLTFPSWVYVNQTYLVPEYRLQNYIGKLSMKDIIDIKRSLSY